MKRYLYGFGVFAVAVVGLLLVGFPLQSAWGSWGLVVSELMILAIALLAAGIGRMPLSSLFPLRPIRKRDLVAFGLLYLAGQLIATFLTAISAGLAPGVTERLEEVSQIGAGSWGMALFSVVLLPAVCEEVLFRGVLRHCFRDVDPWMQALTLGLLFGAFHLDIYRFIPTAVLGVAISYLCIKTDRFALAIGYHLLNNLLAVLSAHGILSGWTASLPVFGFLALFGVGCWILAARILTKR